MYAEYQIMKPTTSEIQELEKLRASAFGVARYKNNHYRIAMKEGSVIPVIATINNIIVAACYVSHSENSLHIDELFVKYELQRTDLHLGSNLLKYVLSKQEYFEEVFNTKLEYSKLYSIGVESNSIYHNIGYEYDNDYAKGHMVLKLKK